jgi:hypothetical protein
VGQKPDRAAGGTIASRDPRSQEADVPGRGPQEPSQQPKQRRLSRAVGPNYGQRLAGVKRQIYSMEDADPAERALQPASF